MNNSSELVKSSSNVYHWYADTIVYRGFGPLIACLGIVGGTLSCLVFRRKALKKKSCSIYFFYLALADLLCMICWLVHFVLPTYSIQLLTTSNYSCKIFVFSMYFAFDLANYILTACSIDRAVSVLFPVGSRKYCRRKMAYTITLILVVIDTFLNSHLIYGFVVLPVNSTYNERVLICHHRSDSLTYQKLFSAYDSYVDVIKTNVIPFIIMSICNLIIIIRVCRSNSTKTFNNRTNKSKRKYEKDRQLTLMLLSSSFAFLVLTLPTEISDIIRSYSNEKYIDEKTYLFQSILLSLAHLNYAIHFYIYTLTGEVFRQQLIKLWPINIIWPYLIRILRCKKLHSSSTTDTTIQQNRHFQINQNPLFDQSILLTKINND